MKIGSAHVQGKYTYPAGSGTQFHDGSIAIFNRGYPLVKLYCSADYLTNYPLETAWSSTPTTLTQLAQTTEFATELARAWDTVVLSCFTFANGSTNWWRASTSNTKLQAEEAEIQALAEHLLSTYNGSGKTFILQNWEGDWAFMDSFTTDTYVDLEMVGRYGAFLARRQKAVEAARRSTPSDCKVLNAIEVNRVLDARTHASRRRIVTQIAKYVQPDIVSYSAYDSTIVDQGGWGADYAAWAAATEPLFRKALRTIQLAFPGVPIQIGEFGFPEGPELPVGASISGMVTKIHEIALDMGVKNLIYWQVFDNEEYSPGVVRGFYLVKPDGSASIATTTLESFL